jgi:hypothetical protein
LTTKGTQATDEVQAALRAYSEALESFLHQLRPFFEEGLPLTEDGRDQVTAGQRALRDSEARYEEALRKAGWSAPNRHNQGC